MSQVLLFQSKPRPDRKLEGTTIVRVINPESHFWNWEGLVTSVLPAEMFPDQQQCERLLVVFAHAGFQFPPMLFKRDDVHLVDQLTKVG